MMHGCEGSRRLYLSVLRKLGVHLYKKVYVTTMQAACKPVVSVSVKYGQAKGMGVASPGRVP